MISIIAAITSDRAAIGRRGDLLFHISEDLRHFKELTTGHTVVMGRNAYDDCGIEHIDGWQEKHFLVASHRPRPADAPPNVEFFCGGLAEKVAEQKRRAQGGIWLFGGGQVASALLRAGLVDEAVIGVLPIILGAGRRLFVGEMPTRLLHLQECTVTDGIAMLHYTNRGRS